MWRVAPFLVEKFKRDRKLTPIGERKPRERAASPVNRELEMLSKMFSLAGQRSGWFKSLSQSEKAPTGEFTKRYLTAEEEKRLMASLTGRRAYLRPVVLLALNTGMGRGEILGLEWENVDLPRGLIYVTIPRTARIG